MTEHLTNDQLRQFLDRDLDGKEILKVDSQLAACAHCNDRLAELAGPDRSLESLVRLLTVGSDLLLEHPSDAQLGMYVDAPLSQIDQGTVNDHLALCPACRETVDALNE